LNPHLAEIQKNLGVCLFQRGEFSKAREALQKAKQLDPQDPKTRFLLGHSSLLLGQADEAASELEYVRKYKPGDDTKLFYLVRVYTKKGQYEKGNEVFRELEQAHPDSVFVHILRGESYDLQERLDEALEEFKKAIALAPVMPKLHFGLGYVFWEQKRFKEAAAEFSEELRLNPHSAPAAYYLGDIALTENEFAKAGQFFRRALLETPGCVDAYVGLGKTYARQCRGKRHLPPRGQRFRPDEQDVLSSLGTAYRRLGKMDESKEAPKNIKP
jgi:tetratricopeptide (TPR) repeat protein